MSGAFASWRNTELPPWSTRWASEQGSVGLNLPGPLAWLCPRVAETALLFRPPVWLPLTRAAPYHSSQPDQWPVRCVTALRSSPILTTSASGRRIYEQNNRYLFFHKHVGFVHTANKPSATFNWNNTACKRSAILCIHRVCNKSSRPVCCRNTSTSQHQSMFPECFTLSFNLNSCLTRFLQRLDGVV